MMPMPPADLTSWHLLAILAFVGIPCLIAWDAQKSVDKDKENER